MELRNLAIDIHKMGDAIGNATAALRYSPSSSEGGARGGCAAAPSTTLLRPSTSSGLRRAVPLPETSSGRIGGSLRRQNTTKSFAVSASPVDSVANCTAAPAPVPSASNHSAPVALL